MIIYVLNSEMTLSHQFGMKSPLKFAVYTVTKFINQKLKILASASRWLSTILQQKMVL